MGCFPLHLLKACTTVKVMTVDGRCLKFHSPIIVKEVLMEYPCHALFLSDSVRSLGARSLPLPRTLSLQPGNVYFLIPHASGRSHSAASIMETSTTPPASSLVTSQSTRRRKVSFAPDSTLSPMFEDRHIDSAGNSMSSFNGAANCLENLKKSSVEFLPSPSEGVLRVKMVVSKKQLACVLREGGDCVSMMEGLLSPLLREAETKATATSDMSCNVSWRPSLQSIPEFTSCPSSK